SSANMSTTVETSPIAHEISSNNQVYIEKEVILPTLKYAAGLGAFGLVISTVQNAISEHKHGAAGVFTRTGGTITGYGRLIRHSRNAIALIGGVFSGTEAIIANIRKTDDWINSACAGCAAGFMAGVRAHSYPLAFGACAGVGAMFSIYEWTGRNKGLFHKSPDERKEWTRRLYPNKSTEE
ncbi:13332_t:CDS:2, partial [Acaulospora morrowiae]